jgi:aspartyl protease family protein
VQIEGGALPTLSVGQKTRDAIILLSVERDGATFDIQGRRVALALSHARTQTSPAAAAQTSPGAVANYAMVPTDERGNLVADGQSERYAGRFAVDTGATFITLPAREASRLGLDYHDGEKTVMKTANGDAFVYRIKLDTVRVGDVAVHNVDAVIMEGNNLPIGMSFLNRMDIRREGSIMTLTQRC